MEFNIKKLLDSSDRGYLFYHREEQKTFYANDIAVRMFGNSKGFVDVHRIFSGRDMTESESLHMDEILNKQGYITYYNVLVKDKSGQMLLSDVKVGYIDDDEVILYIRIHFKEGDRMQITKDHVDGSHKAEFILNFDDKFSVCHGNRHFYEIFNGSRKDFALTYDNFLGNAFTYHSQKGILERIHKALEEKDNYHEDVEILLPNGDTGWYYLDLQRKTLDETGEKLVCFMVCVENRVEIENKLKTVSDYLNVTQELSENLLFFIDLDSRVLYRNEAMAKNYNLPGIVENFPESVPESGVIHPDDLDMYMVFCRNLYKGGDGVMEVRMRVPHGGYEHFRLTCKTLKDYNGTPKEILGKSENIENILKMEERAYFDVLTKTYNKMTFAEKVKDLLGITPDSMRHALVFVGMDNFKEVNDHLGHGLGDVLLEAVGDRLKKQVREHDLMGRIGGDEFAILMNAVGHDQDLLERIHALMDILREEYVHQSGTTEMRVSVGVAIYPDHGRTYEDLFAHGEKALITAKKDGKDRVSLYDITMESKKETVQA